MGATFFLAGAFLLCESSKPGQDVTVAVTGKKRLETSPRKPSSEPSPRSLVSEVTCAKKIPLGRAAPLTSEWSPKSTTYRHCPAKKYRVRTCTQQQASRLVL